MTCDARRLNLIMGLAARRVAWARATRTEGFLDGHLVRKSGRARRFMRIDFMMGGVGKLPKERGETRFCGLYGISLGSNLSFSGTVRPIDE